MTTPKQIQLTERELALVWFALYERADALAIYDDNESRALADKNRNLARRLQQVQLNESSLIRVTVIENK